jgi:hypothetical protein
MVILVLRSIFSRSRELRIQSRGPVPAVDWSCTKFSIWRTPAEGRSGKNQLSSYITLVGGTSGTTRVVQLVKSTFCTCFLLIFPQLK